MTGMSFAAPPQLLRLRRIGGHLLPLQPVTTASSSAALPGVQADFFYAKEEEGEAKLRQTTTQKCLVSSGRGQNYTVEQNGFTLSEMGGFGKVVESGTDLFNIVDCSRNLYPLCEDVLRRAFPSCTKVLVFDHICRKADRYAAETKNGAVATTPLLGRPVHSVHGDYSVRSGFSRARQLLEPHETPERIEQAIGQRFAFVNVWLAVKEIERDPLAMIDFDSLRPRDAVTINLQYRTRKGETYTVLPNESHRWVYYPRMTPGECLVFKVFESAEDPGRARHVMHSSFKDPTSAPDAPPRESIEFRSVVLFGDLPADFAKTYVAPHFNTDMDKDTLQEVSEGPDKVYPGPISDEW